MNIKICYPPNNAFEERISSLVGLKGAYQERKGNALLKMNSKVVYKKK